MKKLSASFNAFSLMQTAVAGDRVVGCLKSVSTLSSALETLNKEISSCGYNKGLGEIEKIEMTSKNMFC